MKYIRLISFVLVVTSIAIAQPGYVNEDDFSKINMGMSLEQVEEVLGVTGILDSTVIYIWPDNNLQVEWVNGKLNSFQTLGLKPEEGKLDGYKTVKEACAGDQGPMTNPLSYEEVVDLLGKEGQEPDFVRYLWNVDQYQTIKVSFRNNKVFSSSMY